MYIMRHALFDAYRTKTMLYCTDQAAACALTIIASPSIERLKSVYPVMMYTCLSNARSFSIIHVLMQAEYPLRYLPEVISANHFSRYEYLSLILEQLQVLLQVQIPNSAPELCEDDSNMS